MPKHICIISHQHLCRNPRVLKEALALNKAGYQVIILNIVYNEKLYQEDTKLIEGTQIKLSHYANLIFKNCSSLIARACHKIGRLVNKYAFENTWAFGYAPKNCLAIALALKADLYICHQELPTYIGTLLLKKGKKVAFDFEDWYSEDLLTADRKYRPQQKLVEIENYALNNAAICYTTSTAMANALAVRYKLNQAPSVIYNSFKAFSAGQKPSSTTIKLIWISQTIGEGRGLELLMNALKQMITPTIEVYLRGNVTDDYKEGLINSIKATPHKIYFLPLIPANEIQADLANYDWGLALELNSPLNKNLTIANKIFHYLSVGLPVIASATQGQNSLSNYYPAHIKYFNTEEELVTILRNINRAQANALSAAILTQYKEHHDWERQEEKLQELIAAALQ